MNKNETISEKHCHQMDTHKNLYEDPVCGMTTENESEFTPHDHEGKTYFFCSEHCLEKFKNDPTSYTVENEESKQPDDTPKGGGRIYTCPMHPEVEQKEAGTCPKCGMALEPLASTMPATRTEYTCPMHPEIVQDEPGSCPKCGMALEPRTISLDEDEKNPEYDYMRKRFMRSKTEHHGFTRG